MNDQNLSMLYNGENFMNNYMYISANNRNPNILKVGHSSNFLYQGFAEKYFLGIYLHGKA